MTTAFDPTMPAPTTRGPFDAALLLRDYNAGPVTATTAETAIACPVRVQTEFAVVVNVTAIKTSAGNETYTLSVETDSAVAFPSTTSVGSITVTATGTYEIPLSDPYLERDSTAAAIRVKATLAGTSPSLTYGAWLAPDI